MIYFGKFEVKMKLEIFEHQITSLYYVSTIFLQRYLFVRLFTQFTLQISLIFNMKLLLMGTTIPPCYWKSVTLSGNRSSTTSLASFRPSPVSRRSCFTTRWPLCRRLCRFFTAPGDSLTLFTSKHLSCNIL